MITVDDLTNYFFLVNENPVDHTVQISVQIEYAGGKGSHVRNFAAGYFAKHSVAQEKALLLSEFLEKLNEAEDNE